MPFALQPPEIRSSSATMFSPRSHSAPAAHVPPTEEPPPDHGPTPDPEPIEQPPPVEDRLERCLVMLSLRRYITWCARRRTFAQMNEAGELFGEEIGRTA